MSLQTALLLCGVVVLALIYWISSSRQKLQRVDERARALHGDGLADRNMADPELAGDDALAGDALYESGEAVPGGTYDDGRPGGAGIASRVRAHDDDVQLIDPDPDASGLSAQVDAPPADVMDEPTLARRPGSLEVDANSDVNSDVADVDANAEDLKRLSDDANVVDSVDASEQIADVATDSTPTASQEIVADDAVRERAADAKADSAEVDVDEALPRTMDDAADDVIVEDEDETEVNAGDAATDVVEDAVSEPEVDEAEAVVAPKPKTGLARGLAERARNAARTVTAAAGVGAAASAAGPRNALKARADDNAAAQTSDLSSDAANVADDTGTRKGIDPQMEQELAHAEQITQQSVGPVFRIDDVDTEKEVDLIAHIMGFDKPALRDRVLSLYRPVEYLLDKPHRILGLSHPTHTWVDLEEEPETGRYTEIVLTMQLANQEGPVSDSQINKFSDLVIQITESVNGKFKFSASFDDAKARAHKLDEFCKRYDVLAVLNVVAKGDSLFTGEGIAQFARDYQMSLGKMKIFHRTNTGAMGGPHLFSLANLYRPGTFDNEDMSRFSTSGLTLFMNVPTTHDPGRAFREMARVGRVLRDRFGAELVDQNKQTLTDQGIQNIQMEVDRLASQMRKEGIAAGSESAVRLF